MKGPTGRRRPTARPAWCSWHKGLADTAQLIQVTEAATGPGGVLYACQGCRTAWRLTPLAERAS